MPMEYLRELERDALPLIESDVVNIDKLRVLRAAGMQHRSAAHDKASSAAESAD